MGFVLDLIAAGKLVAAEGRAKSDPEDLYLWDSLDRALELGVEYEDALEDLGTDGLRDLAASLASSAPLEARLQLMAGVSSFDELTAMTLASAGADDAERQRLAEVRRRRVEFAMKAGEIGLRLLLRFVL